MKARLTMELQVSHSWPDDERQVVRDGVRYWPVGTVLDLPSSFRLVQLGNAEPADAECTARAGMSTEEQKAAQAIAPLVAKGIQPEDYQRYLDGEITGYDEDGNDIPGPNYIETDDDDDDDE